ncbi:PREDICTED: carbonyl reductase family member 4 isoform X2 [Haliaeetus leucocephalus]|uniref:carbonyl reductase family member 4 isoform X2 n=1 Tax=Haliaeetus leucocephalus TaxID=52644 RepID=UPI0005228A51|nr:PREDICTED: carbonyl reductase family member 4 isoform X2 [Haliaeetus albicilla]XP_010568246.1 PREDICTED: carbonyl reductase family member 4 isoform X2 [Haliaeetus leucocephalus]
MGKVCAIFGGSRGIGKAVAELLAQKGCRLAIIARNLEVAQTTACNLGAGHLALSCDVSSEQEVQNTFEEMQRNLGPINYLVNAAGINRDGLLLRTKTEDMIAQIHTNLLGTMLTCKAAVKSMIQQQGGAIVNIGFIHTEMTAHLEEDQLKKAILLGRFGEPREVAQAVVFLLESPYVTGSTLIVDGGLQLLT